MGKCLDVELGNKPDENDAPLLVNQVDIEALIGDIGADFGPAAHGQNAALRLAGPEGIDRLLAADRLDALIAPTVSTAWISDPVVGDHVLGGTGGLAAIAGYPHLTVPMGQVRGLPVGLSFIGAKWDDARILALGYAYEQASHKRVDPTFPASIEEQPDVARHLGPAGR